MEKKRTAVAIIIKNGHVLLLKRKDTDKALPSVYCLPGGKQEGNEDSAETMIREVFEETRLDIGNWRFLEQKENDRFIIDFFVVTRTIGTVTLSDEHESARWVHPKDFKSLAIAPLTEKVLNKYFE